MNILKSIKLKITSIGFELFIWGNSFSREEYWEEIYRQELRHNEKNKTKQL